MLKDGYRIINDKQIQNEVYNEIIVDSETTISHQLCES